MKKINSSFNPFVSISNNCFSNNCGNIYNEENYINKCSSCSSNNCSSNNCSSNDCCSNHLFECLDCFSNNCYEKNCNNDYYNEFNGLNECNKYLFTNDCLENNKLNNRWYGDRNQFKIGIRDTIMNVIYNRYETYRCFIKIKH